MLKLVLGKGSKVGVAVISVAFLLTGCGIFKDRGDEYLQSGTIPPMQVPEGKDSSAVGEIYRIPDVSNAAVTNDKYDVPRPQPLSETRFEETVKIQTFEEKSWILINKPPEEVWPRVRNILSRSSIPTTRVDARTGVMETSWLQFKDDEESRHRFRVHIEPAVQMNSTEVKLLHSQMKVGVEGENVAWPSTSDAKEREKEMLDMVANALATDINSGTISLLAQSIGGESKVEMVTPQVADPYLVIKLSYERSWASVIYSLSRGGFSITDQNQTAGVVFVDFQTSKEVDTEEDGFFSRWFGDDEEETEAKPFQVLVKKAEQGAEVRIVAEDKSSLDTTLSTRLLKIIRANLS